MRLISSPERQGEISLQLCGRVSHHERAVRFVPELLVHFVPEEDRKAVSAALLLHADARARMGTAHLLMSPQYHSASCREYAGGKRQLLLLFMAEDACLFDLGGRAREGSMNLGLDDQDLYIITPHPTSRTSTASQMTLLPDKDKP